jgi:uncharacterized membrane protein YidH (DUF202 family)
VAATRIVGVVLVVIGIVALVPGGVRWTERKTLVDAGPVEITRQEHHAVMLSPILGVGSLIGAVVLLADPTRRRVR